MNLLVLPLTGTPNALFLATYKILASRGGRNPTSTGSGFGGSIKKRGLAPAPFLFCPRTPRFPDANLLVPLSILSVGDCYHDLVPRRRASPRVRVTGQKNEPPVGALAARAWGMEGTTLEFNFSRVYSALPGALVPR
jgi:hypothetical protein